MKKEDLIAGKTILVSKKSNSIKNMYLGCADLVHFISYDNNFTSVCVSTFLIEELESHWTIEQPQSKAVPLEKKVYDFVPVRCKDADEDKWGDENIKLIAVRQHEFFPYVTIKNECAVVTYKQCEFI